MLTYLGRCFRAFNKKSLLFRVSIVLLAVMLLAGSGLVYAQIADDSVYRIAVDQAGNMRLLHTDLNGNFNKEIKKNEFMIELPSNARVLQLITKLEAELVTKLNELGDNITDVEYTISVLESIVNEQGVKIIGLESTDIGQADNITALFANIIELGETVNELEATVSNQGDNITMLWEKITELEANTGNSNNSSNGYGPIILDGLVLYLPLWELYGNTITSQDTYGHICEVTGALWTPSGRLFDGTDDIITCGSDAIIDNIWDDGGTAIAWINPTSDGEGNIGRFITKFSGSDGWSIDVASETAGKVKLELFHFFNGATSGLWRTTATEVTLNTMTMVAIIYNADDAANDALIFINADSKDVTNAVTPRGIRDADAVSTLAIGNRLNTINTFDGTIGEVLLYNRALTPAEIEQIHTVTQWRYQ
ncbi:LamG domain-containing protein [Chloroflexota bacterium]